MADSELVNPDVPQGARAPAPAFLTDSECGRLIAKLDWSRTGLGPPEQWPASLKSAAGIALRSRVPIVLLWGADGVMIYNDAYAEFADGRHPALMGSRVREGWPEVAGFNDAVMRQVLSGETLTYADLELTLVRNGAPEQVWVNLDYSPVPDEHGAPAGVFCVLAETTQHMLAQRREAAERDRLVRMFEQAPAIIGMVVGPQHVFVLSNGAHRELVGGRNMIGQRAIDAHPELGPQGIIALLDEVYRTGQPYRAESMPLRFHRPEGTGDDERLLDFILQPLVDAAGCVFGIFLLANDCTERGRAEHRLVESEERLRLAASAARVGTWDLDLRTGQGQWDAMTREVSGMTSADEHYTARTWTEMVHPRHRQRVKEAFTASLQPGADPFALDFQAAAPAADGGPRWLSARGAVMRDPENGAPIRAVGIVRDVTADRRATAALEESEARFRTLADAVPTFVWYASSGGRIEYLNDRWFDYTGRGHSDSPSQDSLAALHPDDREPVERCWREAIARGASYRTECRFRRYDGAYRWHLASAEPMRDGEGRVICWFGTATDIHEQKIAVERLELALDAGAIVGTWVWDLQIDRLTADDRFVAAFGLDPEAGRHGVPGAVAFAAVHPDDRARLEAAAQESLATGRRFRCEYRVSNGVDPYRWVEASGKVEFDADGNPLRFPGVAVDIAVRKEAEEREQLLAREVDHRAKNLLGVVQGVVQLTRVEDPADLKPAIVGRIHALAGAHSLLAASRWQGVELGALLTEELAPFARDQSPRARMAGPPLRLRAAASQALSLAFHELVTNAVKFGALSSEAGRVEVVWDRIASAEGPQLELTWCERGGPAIAVTPSRRGFGSTVMQTSIERQLGGQITFDWREEGLCCTLRIPASQVWDFEAPAVREAEVRGAAGGAGSLAGRRALVVEDEALIAMQIEDALEAAGCAVIGPASSADAALDLIATERPDFAILDVDLAGERSDRVAEALGAQGVPFLYCTGYSEVGPDLPGVRAEFIAKPLDPQQLVAAVNRLAEEAAAARSSQTG